jgi:hypothetical protein
MTGRDETVDSYHTKSLPELMLFSVSLVFILLFMYINIYMLPLGTTSPEGAVESASDLYGLHIGVGGEVLLTTDKEFEIVDPAASGSLSAVWDGDGDLPLNGTMIIAEGFIIASPAGPVLICESVTPLKATDVVFDNPWSLPSLRLLTIVLLWFSLTTVATGLAALASHFQPKILSEDRARALTEVCALSGLVSFVCLALLAISESGLGGGIGIPTIALSISFFLLLLSVMMHRTERHDVVEMSSALPIAAAIMVLIGIIMIAVHQQLLAADLLGPALAEFLPNFFIAAVVGVTGFVLMGVYLEERRYYTISIRGLLAFGKDEVK